MKLTFGPNNTLIIDDAQIRCKNFSGKEGEFNARGERNFLLVIDDPEIAEALQQDVNEDGEPWKVKIKPPYDESQEPFMYLPVKVKYNREGRGPKITVESNGNVQDIGEDEISMLDYIKIASVDLDIRAYDCTMRGTPHRVAYLNSMWVHQECDRFEARRQRLSRQDDEVPFN